VGLRPEGLIPSFNRSLYDFACNVGLKGLSGSLCERDYSAHRIRSNASVPKPARETVMTCLARTP